MCPPDSVSPPPATPRLLVEVTLGTMVESRHRGSAAVADPNGQLVRGCGNVEALIFARSSIKPIQAMPLVEQGAADAFGLGNAELALAGASHQAEPRHVEAETAC